MPVATRGARPHKTGGDILALHAYVAVVFDVDRDVDHALQVSSVACFGFFFGFIL